MAKKKSQRFSYKQGYDYINHYKHDCEFLSNKILSVNEIGNELINKINSIHNLDNIFCLNSELSYLSQLLVAHIEIFCGSWNELFHKMFGLEFDNNNPFLFINNIFILDKHNEREINDFYHGYFNIVDNINKEESEKMVKLFNNMKNVNIYNVMRALKNYWYIRKKGYFNKCKKHNGMNWALKDFEDIGIDGFLDKKNTFLPLFDSYIDAIYTTVDVLCFKNKKKQKDKYQKNLEFTKLILKEIIEKNTIKKFFKLFIVDQWNKYIDGLQNLMYFFNVFMFINLCENNINDLSSFKNTNFYKDTNWYEQYNADKAKKESNKYKLTKLKKLKWNCKSK